MGYVNTDGKQLIPFKYEDAYEIKGGMYRVKYDNKYGFLNSKGKEQIPCEYEEAGDFVLGCAVVKRYKEKGYFIINLNNEVLTKKTYSIFSILTGDKAYFAEENTKGEIVASGYIDVDGKEIVRVNQAILRVCNPNLFIVDNDGNSQMVDSLGNSYYEGYNVKQCPTKGFFYCRNWK